MGALPVTWAISKVTPWNNIWDFLADEKSSIRWMLTNKILGKWCGFSEGKTAEVETALIAQTMILAKARALAMMKKEPFPKEAEYDTKMQKLYKCLMTPKSFSINVAVYLAEKLLGLAKKSGVVPKDVTPVHRVCHRQRPQASRCEDAEGF